MKKLLPVPKWHAEAITLINENYKAINRAFINSTKRAIWLGLALLSAKDRGKEDSSIPHGMFGPWLEKNFPDLSRSQAFFYMSLANNTLEKTGLKISKVRFPDFCHGGKLPKEIVELISGKTQDQLFLEFKQSESSPEGTLAPKRGRLKGHGGATREQRATAQAAEERAKIEALELRTLEVQEWLTENADDQHLGLINDDLRAKLHATLTATSAYLTRFRSQKKISS